MADFDPMSWLSGLFSGNSPVPNAAADANAQLDANPLVSGAKGPNGRIDANALSSLGPADLSDMAKSAAAYGNARQDAINAYQPTPLKWNQWLGGALQAASVPVGYAQGNDRYASGMQGHTILDQNLQRNFDYQDARAKMGLENTDKTISGMGDATQQYYATQLNKKIAAKQAGLARITSAAIEARDSGQDPAQATKDAAQGIASQYRAMGWEDLAKQIEQQYGVGVAAAPSAPTAPAGTAPVGPVASAPMPPIGQPSMLGGPPQTPPGYALNAGAGLGAAMGNPPSQPQGPQVASLGQSVPGISVAGGPPSAPAPSPAPVAALPASPAPQAPAPAASAPANPSQQPIPQWKQFQKTARDLQAIDPERSKLFQDQADALLKTRRVIMVPDANGVKQPYWVDSADPSVKAVPVMPQDMAAAKQSMAKDIVEGIKSGDLPPDTTGLYRHGAEVKQEIANQKIPLAKMQLEWKSAQAQVSNLNKGQMARFVQLGTSVLGTMGEVQDLAKQMDQGGISGLNIAKLQAMIHLEGNSQRGQLATRYITAVNTLKSEFAQLEAGGYAPHEAVWKLANDQINGGYGAKQMTASIGELQRLINYRINAIPGLKTMGPGASNIYTGQMGSGGQQAAASRPAPKVGDTVAGHVFKGGNPNDPMSWEEVEGSAHEGAEAPEAQ